MTNILRTFSIASAGSDGFSAHERRKNSVSAPTFSNSNQSLQCASGHRIFYNVIQDFLPMDDTQRCRSTEGPGLLNVHKGEVVQFIRTHENNTILVKRLNSLDQGLVALRCLSINVDLTTLSSVPSPSASQKQSFDTMPKSRSGSMDCYMAQIQEPPSASYTFGTSRSSSVSSASNTSDHSHALPNLDLVKSCNVVSIAKLNERIWYRVETTTLSDHKRFLCRYYQDFYKLHCQLIVEMQKLSLDAKLLPTLPKPMANSHKYESFASRLNCFTSYMELLFSSEHIPSSLKRTILYDQWLSPKSGDLVQTPNGSLYKCVIAPPNFQMRWSKKAVDHAANIQQLISEWLHPDATSDRSLSVSSVSSSSVPSSPNLVRPAQFQSSASQPTSPVIPSKPFSQNTSVDTIKMKINFCEDCYVLKCQINDIETWDKLEAVLRKRLVKELPDPSCALILKLKTSSADDRLLALDAGNYDIENILYLIQSRLSNSGSYVQHNRTVTSKNNDANRQSVKLTLEVSV